MVITMAGEETSRRSRRAASSSCKCARRRRGMPGCKARRLRLAPTSQNRCASSHRPARIGDEMWSDFRQTGTKIADETQRGIADVALVALLVGRKPGAVVVLAQLAEKLQRPQREIAHQSRLRSSLPGLKRIVF